MVLFLFGSSEIAPYGANLDTTKFVTGKHEISVRAMDDQGFKDEVFINVVIELQRKDWIFWLIGLIILAAAALFISLGLRRKIAYPKELRKAQLVEVDGLSTGKIWLLKQARTTLGRKASSNDIILKGLNASREHAVIERSQTGYVITAIRLDNHLNINNQSTPQQTLLNGDVIRLGESVFRFEITE
jgi:hypothetical protein